MNIQSIKSAAVSENSRHTDTMRQMKHARNMEHMDWENEENFRQYQVKTSSMAPRAVQAGSGGVDAWKMLQ